MIEIDCLSVRQSGTNTLNKFTAAFPENALTCIIGRNGSGKTTLLRCIAGLVKPVSGAVTVFGENLCAMPPRERAKLLAFMPQTRPVPKIEVRLLAEHGRFPHEGFGRSSDPQGRAIVEKALEQAGIADLAERRVDTLSGGERQRAYLAAALAQDTKLLLLDEPASSLDFPAQLELMSLLKNLAANGKTVVCVTHDLLQAMTYADTICAVHNSTCALCALAPKAAESPVIEQMFGCKVVPDTKPGRVYGYALEN